MGTNEMKTTQPPTMKQFLLLFCWCFLSLNSIAQSDSSYQAIIAKASLLHLQKNYKSTIVLYEKAFKIEKPDMATAYKAAGMYALESNADKAFQYLQEALQSGWTEADWLSFDPYFTYLKIHFANQWKVIEEQAFINERHYSKTLRLPSLRKEINLMTLKDQKLRYERVQCDNDSLCGILTQQIHQSDMDNLDKAKHIVEQYGWPKISEIGKDGQNNLWLIVQHADYDVQFQRRALLGMEKLKTTQEISKENYAFLFDRVQCNLNYKQRYGTQVVWGSNGEASAFRPIREEHLTDRLRGEMGLQPLQIYALSYGFDYQKITAKQAAERDSAYQAHVRKLIDSARYFYLKDDFPKTYAYYNTASTFLGGMSSADNFEAGVVFSKIAAVNNSEQYKSIALDFLDLLYLRGDITKAQLLEQPAFVTLYKEQRWISILKQLK